MREITYVMCAETCIRVAVKMWRGVNRTRSAVDPRLQARSSLYIVHIIYTYHLSSVAVFFIDNLPFSVYYMRLFMKYFFILPNYIIILESVMIRDDDGIARVIQCREKGSINCRYGDIFILDIYFSCNALYTILSTAYNINLQSIYEFLFTLRKSYISIASLLLLIQFDVNEAQNI